MWYLQRIQLIFLLLLPFGLQGTDNESKEILDK